MADEPDQFGRTALEYALTDPPLTAGDDKRLEQSRLDLVLSLADGGAMPFLPAGTSGDMLLRELDLAIDSLAAPQASCRGNSNKCAVAKIVPSTKYHEERHTKCRLAEQLERLLPGQPDWIQRTISDPQFLKEGTSRLDAEALATAARKLADAIEFERAAWEHGA